MAVLLSVVARYLAGRRGPAGTSGTRHRPPRASIVSPSLLMWAWLAGACAVVALVGYWIILASFVRMPGSVLPDLSAYPWWTASLAVAAGAAISPLCEQVGLWGYWQVALEREYLARRRSSPRRCSLPYSRIRPYTQPSGLSGSLLPGRPHVLHDGVPHRLDLAGSRGACCGFVDVLCIRLACTTRNDVSSSKPARMDGSGRTSLRRPSSRSWRAGHFGGSVKSRVRIQAGVPCNAAAMSYSTRTICRHFATLVTMSRWVAIIGQRAQPR